jgi:regulator of protease activity HflC (stomatin/prohibitin superfamily)
MCYYNKKNLRGVTSMDEILNIDSTAIAIALIVFGVIVVSKGARIVPQAELWTVERLGKFQKIIDGGFHILIPFFDQVTNKVSTKEQIIDIPTQHVITKDNVKLLVDGIVFVKVEDARMATYNVTSFKVAISNLSMTTLRAEIGQMVLDDTLSSRDTLNTKLLTAIDEATANWGVKTMRVEIADISPSDEIQVAMEMQMRAEREKRAIMLEAEGKKEAIIRDAEAQKQKAVLEAEAIERMSEAKKYEQIQIAEGESSAINLINESMSQNAKAAEFILAQGRVDAFAKLSENSAKDKVIVPYEATELIGSLSLMSDILKGKKDGA